MKITRTLRTFAISALLVSLTFACAPNSNGEAAQTPGAGGAGAAGATDGTGADTSTGATTAGGADSGGDDYVPDAATGLAAAYSDYFPIGAAIEPTHLTSVPGILEAEFNHLTAENRMKWGNIEPTEGNFTWTGADQIADFARERGWKMTGHTFIWYRESPNWVFKGTIDDIKPRLKAHIDAMVERYGDVVDNWDVVNEAISDGAGYPVRDNPQYDEDVLYWAFEYAKQALEAQEAGSSAGKLYYNDYNVNLKIDSILPLLQTLADRGAQIDGIGLQAHVRTDWPSVADLRSTFEKIVDAGYKIKISELDVTVYNDYPPPTYALTPAPEVELTPELDATIGQRYGELFELFREYKDHITSVTMWGVSDDHTWLNTDPVPGRENYPLLFTDEHLPKQAYYEIKDF